MILRIAPREEIPEIWTEASDLLLKAVDHAHGETDIHHVYDDLIRGDAKMLLIIEDEMMVAAGVMKMSFFPNKKVCQISFAGGSRMDEWCDQGLPLVEELARSAGADAIYIQGRKGWIRRLKNHGFSEYATLIGKELKG